MNHSKCTADWGSLQQERVLLLLFFSQFLIFILKKTEDAVL